jgi:putative transposase
MVGYRRHKPRNPDSEFFLTIVTNKRKNWFTTEADLKIALDGIDVIRKRYGLKFIAWVILPEHLHWLIEPCDADYSKVVFSFKRHVSCHYRRRGFVPKGGKFWQDRFWEHTVRDDDDRERCVEYIHYNPVKHGIVNAPRDWKYSSFNKYVERGIYPADWGDGASVVVQGAEYD